MIFLNHILTQFDPISLEEMDGVRLMNRTDTKFTFSINQFEEILQTIINDYRILEIEGKRISKYKTLYYDTEDLSLYHKHHNGQLNRHKIRHRTYIETGMGFLEVKLKNNKGRTIKNRIEVSSGMLGIENNFEEFLEKLLPFKPVNLQPSIWVIYDRLTLVNKINPERLTIDLKLEFINGKKNKKLGNLIIAEVKQVNKKKSPFLSAMKNFHIREGSISKYCMGIALTNESVKKNNFKEKINHITNLTNDNTTSNHK